FQVSASGITRFGLPIGAIGDVRLPLPPIAEQKVIADFLDDESALIDGLIAKKLCLIQNLREATYARQDQLVCGMRNDSNRVSTSLPCMPSVPGNWRVLRLRFAIRAIEQGWSPVCENRPASDEEWGVLKVGCVNAVEFDASEQ